MGRPKKREQRDPLLARTLPYYVGAHNEELPDDKDLLHDIIKALLTRLSSIDDNAVVARRAYHAIRLLMVVKESWSGKGVTRSREMYSHERIAFYGDLLCEIAEAKSSREEHWGPAFRIQREELEVFLRDKAFPAMGARRGSWLAQHGEKLNDFFENLRSIPCYCAYAAAVSLDQFSEDDLKGSKTLDSFIKLALRNLHGMKKGTVSKYYRKYCKASQPDDIPIWHPGLESSLQLFEIERRTTPPFPPFPTFESPHHHPNF